MEVFWEPDEEGKPITPKNIDQFTLAEEFEHTMRGFAQYWKDRFEMHEEELEKLRKENFELRDKLQFHRQSSIVQNFPEKLTKDLEEMGC